MNILYICAVSNGIIQTTHNGIIPSRQRGISACQGVNNPNGYFMIFSFLAFFEAFSWHGATCNIKSSHTLFLL